MTTVLPMTSKPIVHICIATGHNLANLIPALQLNASKVVILETPDMRDSAANLKPSVYSRGWRNDINVLT